MYGLVDRDYSLEEDAVEETILENDIRKVLHDQSSDDEAEGKVKVSTAKGESEQALAARLRLRYIKKDIEALYKLKNREDWAKTSNKVEVLFKMLKDLH